HVVASERRQRDSAVVKFLLPGAREIVAGRLQQQFGARTVGRDDRQPPGAAGGEIVLLHEAQLADVEILGLLLVAYQHGGQIAADHDRLPSRSVIVAPTLPSICVLPSRVFSPRSPNISGDISLVSVSSHPLSSRRISTVTWSYSG